MRGPAWGTFRRRRGPEQPGAGATDDPLPGVPRPAHSDWAWRPAPWRGPAVAAMPAVANGARLGADTRVFHDGPADAVAITGEAGATAPFALRLATAGFGGSFLSLAIDLPEALVLGLHPRHIIGCTVDAGIGQVCRIYARLNLRQGPNTGQMLREVPPAQRMAEFDLAYAGLEAGQPEAAWVDLIFESPGETVIDVADVIFSRRPRAEF